MLCLRVVWIEYMDLVSLWAGTLVTARPFWPTGDVVAGILQMPLEILEHIALLLARSGKYPLACMPCL